jgi:hypothetical protein
MNRQENLLCLLTRQIFLVIDKLVATHTYPAFTERNKFCSVMAMGAFDGGRMAFSRVLIGLAIVTVQRLEITHFYYWIIKLCISTIDWFRTHLLTSRGASFCLFRSPVSIDQEHEGDRIGIMKDLSFLK